MNRVMMRTLTPKACPEIMGQMIMMRTKVKYTVRVLWLFILLKNKPNLIKL